MIQLFDKETGAAIGEVSEDQLKFLVGELEEESANDKDYYLNSVMVDGLEDDGADAALVSLLRRAMGDKGEIEIRW